MRFTRAGASPARTLPRIDFAVPYRVGATLAVALVRNVRQLFRSRVGATLAVALARNVR